jgi:type II secretory pathway component PulK
MKFQIFKKNQGMALVAVLMMSALLIALYLRFMDNAGLKVRLEARKEASLQMRWSAHAGIEYAISLLAADKGVGDSYEESWKTISNYTASNSFLVGPCSCSIEIHDESAKANINAVDIGYLTKVLRYYNLGISDSSSILGEDIELGACDRLAQHIMDYIDTDNDQRAMGAEENAYLSKGLSAPRNDRLNDIRELLNIPGVTRDIFLASGTRPGLIDLFSVYNGGKINVNTAKMGIIEAVAGLPGSYDSEKRRDYFEKLSENRPFMGLAGFTNFIVDYDWNINKMYTIKFTNSTEWFRIVAHAQIGEAKRTAEAIVHRSIDGKIKILRYCEIP